MDVLSGGFSQNMAAKEYNRKDHLYQKAKKEGYRSRAAYKLLEIDKKYNILRPGFRVADLGCFPGSWLQVAQQQVGKKGMVIGIDLKDVEPLAGDVVKIIKGDLTTPEVVDDLMGQVQGRLNVVLSDLSPSLSGIRIQDALRSADLVERAFYFATNTLVANGSFVAKIFPGSESDELSRVIRRCFTKFSRMHLTSTRGSSKEYYFVGIGYKPNEKPEW